MIAALYDVHGNLPALEAVVADAVEQGTTGFVLGGDYALFGGWPVDTVARLHHIPEAVWIRGNGERWTAAPAEAPDDPTVQGAIAACAEALGDTAGELSGLPERAAVGDWLVVHGSPLSDVRSFLPDASGDEAELLAGEAPPRLLFGHTHLPFARRYGSTLLVNPGSVGMPLDGDPRAAYALLGHDGAVEHRRVAYDHLASAAKVRSLGGEWAETVARRVETARWA